MGLEVDIGLDKLSAARRSRSYLDDELGSVTYTCALALAALKGYVKTRKPQPALR